MATVTQLVWPITEVLRSDEPGSPILTTATWDKVGAEAEAQRAGIDAHVAELCKEVAPALFRLDLGVGFVVKIGFLRGRYGQAHG